MEGEDEITVHFDGDIPLCCCEYLDQCGNKRHMLQTFCDCAALDDFVTSAVEDEFDADAFWRAVYEVDRRIMIPTFHGAKHIGLEFPLALVTFCMLYLSLSVNIYLSVLTICIIPMLAYKLAHLVIRHFPQTRYFFFLSSLLALSISLSFAATTTSQIYMIKILSCLVVDVSLIFLVNKMQSCVSSDSSALIHKIFCRICHKEVHGKDHHCIWLNCCIHSANLTQFRLFGAVSLISIAVLTAVDADLINLDMNGLLLYRTSCAFLLILVFVAVLLREVANVMKRFFGKNVKIRKRKLLD